MPRINDKIKNIEEYLDQLKDAIPSNIEEYKKNTLERAACERFFEKIIESIIDLAFLTIKSKKLELPEDEVDAFRILENHKIITNELCTKLKLAKGMRNFIAHQYDKIDDELVFDSIKNNLENDIKDFIKAINLQQT
tara:strand:+ start:1239 stop:1649 length:411 start_codon:yes stop_codon:yes gene_type:complete